MLFLGTEKYPEEDAFSKWLSSHGGEWNGMTDLRDTIFKFYVHPEYLEGSLDRYVLCTTVTTDLDSFRFSQFFLRPLFTESATAREMNAVDAGPKLTSCLKPSRIRHVSTAG